MNKIKMITFQHRTWKLLTTYEKVVGTWPYQSKIKNYLLRICSSFIIISTFIPLWQRLIKEIGVSTRIVVENSITIMSMIIIMMKLFMPAIYERQRRNVYEHVVKHFNTITNAGEVEILRKHSDGGLRFSFIYTAVITISIGIFYVSPFARMLYIYLTAKISLEMTTPLFVDYIILDEKEDYYIIIFHILLYFAVCVAINLSFDTSFIIGVRHVCALFEIVRMRLQRASDVLGTYRENIQKPKNVIKEANALLSEAICMHNEVLRMVALIEEAFNISWFFILLINTMLLGTTLLAHSLLLYSPFLLLRCLMTFIMFSVHLYVVFSQGQTVISASESVFEECYNCTWYNAPKSTCTLVSVIMSRSFKPCTLTGGKGIFNLSMETYGEMLKLGFSMFTVFKSLQHKRNS